MTGFVIDPVEQAKAPHRVNVGAGRFPLLYWVNIDADPACPADIHATVPPLPFADASLDDIYAGHFLEHLTRPDAGLFLSECVRCLVPGGRLGILVPDTREIMRRYLDGSPDEIEYPAGVWSRACDLDDVCALFLYSTAQASQHRWSWDRSTLARAMRDAGLAIQGEINRFHDPRVATGAWYQVGIDAIKPKET